MAKNLFSPQEAQKRYSQLPSEIKDLIYSPEMLMIVRQVGQKNQLHLDQMGALEDETSAVMLGFVDTADYASNLTDVLQVEKTKADSIAKDIDETLFAKIRDAMKKVYEKSKTMTEAPPSSPPAMNAPLAAVSNKPDDKSVVMPSSVTKVPQPPAPVPPIATTPASTPLVTAPAKPAELPAMSHIDTMLSEPTVSIAPAQTASSAELLASSNAKSAGAPVAPAPSTEAPPSTDSKLNSAQVKPGPIYKTDPYHEPID